MLCLKQPLKKTNSQVNSLFITKHKCKLDTSALRLIHQGGHLCIFYNCKLSLIQFEILGQRAISSAWRSCCQKCPYRAAMIAVTLNGKLFALCPLYKDLINYSEVVRIEHNPSLHALM